MGYRLSKIYTRTGDKGTTGLGDGTRVDKDSLRVEAYGAVDELNSLIGLLATYKLSDVIAVQLTDIEHDLFDIGGELSIPGHSVVSDQQVERLEVFLDTLNAISNPCRSSYCRAERPLPPFAIWHAPYAAGQSAELSLWRGRRRSMQPACVTLIGYPTCCSCWLAA